MKIHWKKLAYYIPLFLAAIIILMPSSANAGVISWIAKRLMGIDTTDNCPVPPFPHSNCMFCDLFKVIFNAGSYVATKAYSSFHTDLGRLVAIFLCVSLAIIVLRNIASMGAREPGTLINEILQKTFVCISILIIITQDYYNILNLTLVPIFSTALDFISIGSTTPTSCGVAGGMTGFSGAAGAQAGAGMPASIGSMVVCAIDTIENKIDILSDYGDWAFCRGTGPDRVVHEILPHPVYLVDAVFFYLGKIFFLLAYPWVLGDAVIQLGISLALLPFAVAGYAFSGTRGYLPKVFSWILHSLFTFLFMAILLSCVLDYIGSLLISATAKAGDPKVFFTDPNVGLAFYGANMLFVVFALWIGYTYMPITSELAENFSEGSGLSAAQNVGNAVVNQAEKQAKRVGNAVAQGTATVGKATASTIKRGTNNIGRGMGKGIVNVFGTANAQGGKTLKLGKTASVLTLGLARNVSFSTVKNLDGTKALKREYKSITGRKHVKISDRYTTIRQEYSRNGSMIKNKVNFKHNFVNKHLFDKTGKINAGALKKLLASPLGQNPQYRQAIMAEIAKRTMKAKLGRDVGKYFHNSHITFNPLNPSQIIIKQQEHRGIFGSNPNKKVSTIMMDIDMTTGQIALQHSLRRGDTYENIFDNGLVTLTTKGKYDSSGAVVDEKTKIKYSAAVMANHDKIDEKLNGRQVVEANGTISSLVNGSNGGPTLTHGMDNFYGHLTISRQTASQYVVNNVLAESRRKKSSTLNTNFGAI